MTGCEIVKCNYYYNGICNCPSEYDYVNKETGEDMCYLNSNAISREEFEED